MQYIRENQLKRIKVKFDFLKEIGALPPELQPTLDAVCNLELVEKVGKEGRDRNWTKIELIEMIINKLLKVVKLDMSSGECENCNKCDDKIKIIDQFLSQGDEYDPENLKNLTPIGEC